MHTLVTPDSFAGTLSALQVADAMVRGWRRGAPRDLVEAVPLADGGPGFVDALHSGLGGELIPVTVDGPLGDRTPAVLLVVPGRGGGSGDGAGPTVYVESAQAVGLHLVPAHRRDPTRTTSLGMGRLLRAALDTGARRIVVGLGGSATNDAGAGLLAGLGGGPSAPVLCEGGGALSAVTEQDLEGLAAVRRELAGVDLVVASDLDVPLLGLHGASAGYAEEKGATPDQAQSLERALGHFATVAARRAADDGLRRDLLGGERDPVRALVQVPGGGAAGGLGFALALLGGRVLAGAAVVADAVDLAGKIAQADVVVTGTGSLESVHGTVVGAVAERALDFGIPVVAVAGQVLLGRREWAAAGLAGVYAVAERPDQVGVVSADPAGSLARRVERVARTWSR